MAHTVMGVQVTGYVVTASDWNEMVNNFIAGATDAMAADGDIFVGTAANAGAKLAAFTSATGTLKHESGGLEFDASAVTTGDIIVGQSAGVMGLETAMSQAQAEAGTDTQVRGITAERVKQAIAQNATPNPLTALLDIATFAIAGNGGTEGIKISAAGEVNMAKQPSFSARVSGDLINVTGGGTLYTVVFGTEIFDQNADFDGTSTFTAPITGKYLFTVHISLLTGFTTASTEFLVQLATSNRTYPLVNTGGLPDGVALSFNRSASVIADMDASDTAIVKVRVTNESGDITDIEGGGGNASLFTGQLIA